MTSAIACLKILKGDISDLFSTSSNRYSWTNNTEEYAEHEQLEEFLRPLDAEIKEAAIKLWSTIPAHRGYPAVSRSLLAKQLFLDFNLRETDVCPRRQGLPAIIDLSKEKSIQDAFLVACAIVKDSCACADCQNSKELLKKMSDEVHEKAEQILKTHSLWHLLPITACRYASFVPAEYNKLAWTNRIPCDGNDIEDCLGRNSIIRCVDYLDEKTALSRIEQLLALKQVMLGYENIDKLRDMINHQDILGRTALHVACQKKNLRLVELLLLKGASPTVHTVTGASPLHFAAAANTPSICRILLHKSPLTYYKKDNLGRWPISYAEMKKLMVGGTLRVSILRRTQMLHEAINQRDHEQIRQAIKLGADTNQGDFKYKKTPVIQAILRRDLLLLEILGSCPHTHFYGSKKPFRISPLLFAVHQCFTEGIKYLVQRQDVDVNENGYGGTPLTRAIITKNKDIISMLLERHDIDTNLRSSDGNTPLVTAITEGNEDIVKLLLERHDIDVNFCSSNSTTPLVIAIILQREGIVKLLLKKHEIDVNLHGSDRMIPLMTAVEERNEAIVKLLLERHDIDVNVRGSDGNTLLISAILTGNKDLVKKLLKKHDIDVNLPGLFDRTAPIHVASACVEITHLLLSKENIKVNAQDGQGRTALIKAAVCCHWDVVRRLLQHKDVDVNIRTKTGETAVDITKTWKHDDIVELLEARNC